MLKNEFTFPSADGKTTIHAVEWLPEGNVRAVLQIAHGVSEYAARYAPLAEFLTQRGYAVTANDHIGHGQSLTPGAPIAHFTSADAVVDDMYRLRNLEGKKFPDRSYFLLGHSMGSYLTRSYLIRYPGTLTGAIVMGTGQMRPLDILYCSMVAQRDARKYGWERTSPAVNRLSFNKYNKIFKPTRTEYDWLSADSANVDRYIADPLCGADASLALCRETLRLMRAMQKPENLRRMNLSTPILFLSGGMDPVGGCGKEVQRAYDSFRKAGVREVRMKLYPGCRHEILNDACREDVFDDVLTWCSAHAAPVPSDAPAGKFDPTAAEISYHS